MNILAELAEAGQCMVRNPGLDPEERRGGFVMYWNHRVIRTEHAGEPFYAVHECHYADGETIPHSWTSEPADVSAETRDGLFWVLSAIVEGIALPVLEVGPDGKLHEVEPARELSDALKAVIEKGKLVGTGDYDLSANPKNVGEVSG